MPSIFTQIAESGGRCRLRIVEVFRNGADEPGLRAVASPGRIDGAKASEAMRATVPEHSPIRRVVRFPALMHGRAMHLKTGGGYTARRALPPILSRAFTTIRHGGRQALPRRRHPPPGRPVLLGVPRPPRDIPVQPDRTEAVAFRPIRLH